MSAGAMSLDGPAPVDPLFQCVFEDKLGGRCRGSVKLVELEHISSGTYGKIVRCEMQRGGRGPWNPVAVKMARKSSGAAAVRSLEVETEALEVRSNYSGRYYTLSFTLTASTVVRHRRNAKLGFVSQTPLPDPARWQHCAHTSITSLQYCSDPAI